MLNFEENRPETKEERAKRGAIYEISYQEGRPDKDAKLEIFDKSGNVRTRLLIDRPMAKSLRDSLNNYLGESGA